MPPTTPETDNPHTTDQTRPAHPDTSLYALLIKEFAALSGTHETTNSLITAILELWHLTKGVKPGILGTTTPRSNKPSPGPHTGLIMRLAVTNRTPSAAKFMIDATGQDGRAGRE
ncbi:hypothetical protein [Micromonospora chalcea]|uniref:hypothetical protein n=1 Tax=Micromonospora chalcea TaxID=1874 RepID=UPI000D48675E|nr:hypothetical protein [Micromonospora chalcea]PPA58215.1 hypothetical protein BAW75_21655 [Micromonospora chalcea]